MYRKQNMTNNGNSNHNELAAPTNCLQAAACYSATAFHGEQSSPNAEFTENKVIELNIK